MLLQPVAGFASSSLTGAKSVVLKTGHDQRCVLYELASNPEPTIATLLNQRRHSALCHSFTLTGAEICTLALHRSDAVSVKVARSWRTHTHESVCLFNDCRLTQQSSLKIDTGGPAGMYASWTSQLPLQLLMTPGPMQQALIASAAPSLRSI